MFWEKKKRLHFWTLIVFFLISWKLLLRLWLGHFAHGQSELILLLMWFSSPTSLSSSSPSNRSRGLTALLYRGHIRHQALESTGEAHAASYRALAADSLPSLHSDCLVKSGAHESASPGTDCQRQVPGRGTRSCVLSVMVGAQIADWDVFFFFLNSELTDFSCTYIWRTLWFCNTMRKAKPNQSPHVSLQTFDMFHDDIWDPLSLEHWDSWLTSVLVILHCQLDIA